MPDTLTQEEQEAISAFYAGGGEPSKHAPGESGDHKLGAPWKEQRDIMHKINRRNAKFDRVARKKENGFYR